MLVQEFTERTGYEPMSTQEWEMINQVYSDSALDKDSFCQVWVSMHKEEIAIQKKAKHLHKVAYLLANLSASPKRLTKGALVEFFRDNFAPNALRRISELCNNLSPDANVGYIQIINNHIVWVRDLIAAGTEFFNNAQQSPIFKVSLDGKMFVLELLRNIPMYDFTKVSVQFNQTYSY